MSIFDYLWLFFILSSIQPVVQQKMLFYQRTRALRSLEKRNNSRAITLIHRREGLTFLGIPFGGYIDIEDSEAVIRAIELTGPTVPIDLVLHTPGGLVLAAEQIAAALAGHPASVTVYVPHYAMSGGTLISLASGKIVMSPSAVLGPVDPQIGDLPAASIIAAVAQKPVARVDDKTLILADISRKAQAQVRDFVSKLLAKHLGPDRAADIAATLSEGRWTHDFPIDVNHARELGLTVSTELPEEVRLLMRLYPQARGRRPSVEYIPMPYELPAPPSGSRRPAPAGRQARRQ